MTCLWGIYKHSGNVEDFTKYKEALNMKGSEQCGIAASKVIKF